MEKMKTDRGIFFGSIILLVTFTLPLLIFPEESKFYLNGFKIFIENNFGSLYQLLAFTVFIFAIWLAFGKHGKIVLGENSYNFSTFSWASMLFCAGVATGILYSIAVRLPP